MKSIQQIKQELSFRAAELVDELRFDFDNESKELKFSKEKDKYEDFVSSYSESLDFLFNLLNKIK